MESSNQQHIISGLKTLLEEKKFLEDNENFYPGATSEDERIELQDHVNSLIKTLLELPGIPSKEIVLEAFTYIGSL